MIFQPWKCILSKNLMAIGWFVPLFLILTTTSSIRVTAIKRNEIHSRNYITKVYFTYIFTRSTILNKSLCISYLTNNKNKYYFNFNFKEFIESSLQTINEIATENLGTKCTSKAFHPLQVPLNTARYEGTRQKADLASIILQDVGLNYGGGKFMSSLFKTFLLFCLVFDLKPKQKQIKSFQ